MIVTIIGARVTPPAITDEMRKIAHFFAKNGAIVRTGKAAGADAAAVEGCILAKKAGKLKAKPEVYIPWNGYGKEYTQEWDILLGDDTTASKVAERMHPAWERCSGGVRKLYTRNVGQILGKDLDTPTDLVLYWCKEMNRKPTGGTALAVNLGEEVGAARINMLHPDWRGRLRAWFDAKQGEAK